MQVAMSEGEFAGLADRARSHGIDLVGREGLIKTMGVTARWAYDGAMLTVEVVDKPFFLSKQMIEDTLRQALA